MTQQPVLPKFEDACRFVLDLRKTMPFDKAEQFLRTIDSCIFLFGEDAKHSQYAGGRTTLPGTYILSIGVRQNRQIACRYVEAGCHDVNENLRRLAHIVDGVSDVTMEEYVRREIEWMASKNYRSGIQHKYTLSVIKLFEEYFAKHPEIKQKVISNGVNLEVLWDSATDKTVDKVAQIMIVEQACSPSLSPPPYESNSFCVVLSTDLPPPYSNDNDE